MRSRYSRKTPGIDALVRVLDQCDVEAGEAGEFLGDGVAFLGGDGAALDQRKCVFGLRKLSRGGDGFLEIGLEIGGEFLMEVGGGGEGGEVGKIGQVIRDIGAEGLEVHDAGEDDEAVDEEAVVILQIIGDKARAADAAIALARRGISARPTAAREW